MLLGSNAQSKGKNRTAPFITKNESGVFNMKKIITEGKKVLGHPFKIFDFVNGSGSYNTKKKLTIIALSLTAACLAGGLFYYVGTLGNSEPTTQPTQTPPPVESQVVVPEIKPDNAQSSADNSGTPSVDGDVQDKPSDGEPKTQEEATPPAYKPNDGNSSDNSSHGTTNPETNNPSKPPEYKPEQKEPNKKPDQPQGGDTKKDGSVYVPGFGWIEDEGENSQGTAPNAGTGKPVGDM